MSRVRLALCIALLSTSFVTSAADMFLKLSDIQSESTDAAHAKEIDVLSWSWGLDSPTGRVHAADLHITKYTDRATPALMQKCSNGSAIPNAVLTARSSGPTALEFVKIGISNLLVSSLSCGGQEGDDRLVETVSFDFAQIRFDYFFIESGTVDNTSYKWDFVVGDTSPLDSDHDGMPDSFEQTYGLDILRNDAGLDKDADGMSNYDEFLVGTSPNDRNSVFKCRLVYQRGQPAARLSWNSVPGRQYRVRYAENLGEPLKFLGDYTAATSSVTEIMVSADLARRFHRVQVKLLE